MARSQNEEAQQIPAEKQENETASHTVLSEVMGKTMQFATTISNKIYDLSLYTGIKLVRTVKRLKKLYLYRFAKCKAEAYAHFTAAAEKRAAQKVDKAPNRELHPLELFAQKRDKIATTLRSAKAEGSDVFARQILAYLCAGTKKRSVLLLPCAQLCCAGCRHWYFGLYSSFPDECPICIAGGI